MSRGKVKPRLDKNAALCQDEREQGLEVLMRPIAPQHPRHIRRGFTLLEVMIVVAIITILAALGTGSLRELIPRMRTRKVAHEFAQQVEFIRNDTGEQIFQSKAIPVGSKIERAALDVELPAGTYECTAMFHNLDPVSGEIIGTAGAIINITIKN